MLLDLTPDELLATTRSVRRRLDLTRPVEREVLEECLRLAQQAPTASYAQNWHFVVVTDPQQRAALGELWRSVAGPYVERRAAAATADQRVARISDAVRYLADHLQEVPVHVIPCVEGRTDHALQAGRPPSPGHDDPLGPLVGAIGRSWRGARRPGPATRRGGR
jgi:nitroreductase